MQNVKCIDEVVALHQVSENFKIATKRKRGSPLAQWFVVVRGRVGAKVSRVTISTLGVVSGMSLVGSLLCSKSFFSLSTLSTQLQLDLVSPQGGEP